MTEEVRVVTGRAESFGWLRRKECDAPGVSDVWEDPEGNLYAVKPGTDLYLMRVGSGGAAVLIKPKAK